MLIAGDPQGFVKVGQRDGRDRSVRWEGLRWERIIGREGRPLEPHNVLGSKRRKEQLGRLSSGILKSGCGLTRQRDRSSAIPTATQSLLIVLAETRLAYSWKRWALPA